MSSVGVDQIKGMEMPDNLLDLDTPKRWPMELQAFLDRHHALLLSWETGTSCVRGRDYDAAIYGLQDLLGGYSVIGWHCTRLTGEEIAAIVERGMQLPDGAMLHRRLEALLRAGVLTEIVADKLKTTNQANDDNRAGTLWFCFYPPRLAGEDGIARFFRHWGGEALYNSHEDDPETGTAIAGIGRPCLIEAVVPISGLDSTRAAFNVARRHLIHRGLETEEPIELEGPSRRPLPASAIRRIITFPDKDFVALTRCDAWRSPLLSSTPD